MKNILILFSLILLFGSCKKEPGHPRIYITNDKKAAFTEKLNTAEWAKSSFEAIKDSVEKYVDRHVDDPEWIISRMQMYWDTHHERIYVIGNEFSHGTGRAPVPTVKFQGHRDFATDYATPSLEDTQPYMDEKGMYVQNTKKEGQPWEWVHPSKTGRMIGPMNERIMGLAADAAFLHWYTGEEKYATFASDIFMTYIRGMHHRREPFALEQYGNSHLMGLATFEVILDGIIPHLAVCYDFLHAYLKKKGEDFEMITSVLKRFADQEIMYGVPDNNWNIFQARFVTYLALALESDSHYKDGKGRQYYINEIMNHTTIRQFALKEAVADIFDQETGMWPESANYSMSVCKDMLDIICLIDNAENNRMLDTFAILKKAVPATVEYLFPNGRITAFGDAKYVPLNAHSFEMLAALYRKYGEPDQEKETTQILRKLIDDKFYNRRNKSMFSLFFYVDELMDIPAPEIGYDSFTSNMFYAPNTSWLMQRNGKNRENGMALTLVGSFGNHAQTNGVSMEMYAKGLMLAPESSFGVSYSTRDNQEYYARFPAHNTVCVDGISEYPYMRSNYPYELLSCYPQHGDKEPITGNITFARVAFTEPRTNAKQERLTGIVRLDETTGYVVDIFRSMRNDGKDKKHEYFYHSIGRDIDVMAVNGQKMSLSPTNELSSALGDMRGYDYFKNKKAVSYGQNFSARFNIRLEKQDDVFVDMWMKGFPERTVFTAEAPKSNAFGRGSVPDELLNQPLPTLIVRQNGEAWNRPFVSVFYPYMLGENKSVQSVDYFGNQKDFTGIIVTSAQRTDYIFNTTGEQQTVTQNDMQFQGDYAIVGEAEHGIELLFLGNGKLLQKGKYSIKAESSAVTVSVSKEDGMWNIDASGAAEVTIPSDIGKFVTNITTDDMKINMNLRPDGTSVIKLGEGKYQIK